jgi:hypothetical protein
MSTMRRHAEWQLVGRRHIINIGNFVLVVIVVVLLFSNGIVIVRVIIGPRRRQGTTLILIRTILHQQLFAGKPLLLFLHALPETNCVEFLVVVDMHLAIAVVLLS